jgi:hypothetical protein
LDQALADDGRCRLISPPTLFSVEEVGSKVCGHIVFCRSILHEDIDVILPPILEVGQERVALQGILAEIVQALEDGDFKYGRRRILWS